MNLSDGGKNRPRMKGIEYRGFKSALSQRGLWREGMRLDEARDIMWDQPDVVSGAVICGTGAGSEDPAAWTVTIQGWIDLLEGPGIEAFAAMYLADPILANYADRSPAAREFLWKAITSNTAKGLALGLRGTVGPRPPVYSLREGLARLALPTAIVVGDRDHWCTKVSAFLAGTIPGAELVEIADSGHMSNLEQPEQFNRALRRFLERAEAHTTRSR